MEQIEITVDEVENFICNHPKMKFISNNNCACPVAKCLKHKLEQAVVVEYTHAWISGTYFKLPEFIRSWIEKFDTQMYGHRDQQHAVTGAQLIESIERGSFR